MSKRIVILGMGAAGGSAALTARRMDRKTDIIVVDRISRSTYSKCGLPFVISGVIPSFDTLTVISRDAYKRQNISVKDNTEILGIDTDAKVLKVKGSDGNSTIDYDKLILATGGYSAIPPIPGVDLRGVLSLRSTEDGERIVEAAGSARSVVVNGASFIALEVAESLLERGLEVSVVIRSRALRSMVDKSISRLIHKHLEEIGMNVLLGNPVSSINGTDKVGSVTVGDEEIGTDLVVIATGTRPDVDVAKMAGLTLGETGGIKVDETLRTSAGNVYAAGDCVECTDGITGKPTLVGLGTIAARQGIVAAMNAMGGNEKAPPVFNAAVMKLMGLEIGSVGITEDRAAENGIEVAAQTISYHHLPHYYPGGRNVKVRLLADTGTGKLVGAQFISEVPINSRVNAMSIAIQKGMTVKELAMADFCYSPPCADTWDPASVCAQALSRKLKKMKMRKR